MKKEAVVQIGSTQVRVQEGDKVLARDFKVKAGDKVELDKVLMVVNDKDVKVGQPFVKGAKVTAIGGEQVKGTKKVTLKYRRRKDSAVKKGSRDTFAVLKIDAIKVS